MNVTTAYLTNGAFGHRTAPPSVLLCLHVTGNPKNQGPDAATGERTYANREYPKLPNGQTNYSGAASAHYYVNRDGSAVHAINEAVDFAWSNGVVRNPSPNARRLVAYPLGANAACRLEIECVGTATTAGQPTDAQLDTVARLVAPWVAKDNLPLDRTTVLGHFDVDSVDRASCPFIPIEHDRMDAVISRIKALVAPKEEDMGLAFAVTGGGGTFTVNGAGHELFRLDDPSVRATLDDGRQIAVAAQIELEEDLDKNAGDRKAAVLFVGRPGLPAEAALRMDGTFSPAAADATVASVTVTYADGRTATVKSI